MAFLQRNNADDLLFPQNESGQTRFNHMSVSVFNGAYAPHHMATFIREYTNRDGSVGLPPAHIGATSPYIDGGNQFYIYYQDNAKDPHLRENFATDEAHAAAEVTRAEAIIANDALRKRLIGSDAGWRNF